MGEPQTTGGEDDNYFEPARHAWQEKRGKGRGTKIYRV